MTEIPERVAASLRRRAKLRISDQPSLAIERLGFSVLEEYLGAGVYGHTERGSRVIRVARARGDAAHFRTRLTPVPSNPDPWKWPAIFVPVTVAVKLIAG